MDINEFRKIPPTLAKKYGKTSKNAKEILGKMVRQFGQSSESNYEGEKEGWS